MEPKRLTIIHYNDAYQLEEKSSEPVGGASRLYNFTFKIFFVALFTYAFYFRFVGAIKQREHKNPLVLCSGDIWSPSMCMKDRNFNFILNSDKVDKWVLFFVESKWHLL